MHAIYLVLRDMPSLHLCLPYHRVHSSLIVIHSLLRPVIIKMISFIDYCSNCWYNVWPNFTAVYEFFRPRSTSYCGLARGPVVPFHSPFRFYLSLIALPSSSHDVSNASCCSRNYFFHLAILPMFCLFFPSLASPSSSWMRLYVDFGLVISPFLFDSSSLLWLRPHGFVQASNHWPMSMSLSCLLSPSHWEVVQFLLSGQYL